MLPRKPVVKAAFAYFGPVFAAAFLLGILRVTLIVPALGQLAATALELPVVLALAWFVAGRVLARWPLALPGRLAMGALAFLLLMAAELFLAVTLAAQTPAAWAASLVTPPGALGLLGQIGFALIPAFRRGSAVAR